MNMDYGSGNQERLKVSADDYGIDKQGLLGVYEKMALIRKFELAVQDHYRKGEIPGFIHLYIGQEAVAAGVCHNLRKDDWVTSTHRGHGHALAKGVDAKLVLAELYGKASGCCGGRGGSMHLYSYADGLFGTNGIVGAGNPLAVGLGISAKTQGTDRVAVSFFGDGATNHGTFHESVNLAAVQNAPVVFVCENNLYATCLPIFATTRNSNIASKAASYGIPGVRIDGNDVLAVLSVAAEAVERARSGQGPTLIEALTYRTVGHHEGDVAIGTYRTREELEEWKKKCPILKFENYLIESGVASREELDVISARIDGCIAEAVEFARSSKEPETSTLYNNCWAIPVNPPAALQPVQELTEKVTQNWLDAVRDGIAEEMRRDQNIIYMGEGIGERGGTYGHTKNLWQEFSPKRVIDTPICELAFTGAAISASAAGCRTIADLMFSEFIFDAASQIIDQASKLRYMSNGQISVPVIIRAGAGQIKQAGPHHSGTYHSIWAHCPGLIVAIPSNPADAKGLMKTALRAGDPVIFFESKALFSSKGPVPVGEHFVPFGKANIIEQGSDITIVSFGQPLHRCVEAAKLLREQNITCEIIDLRTIVPLDVEAVVKSVSKTGGLLVVDEAYPVCSVGSELAAIMMESAFGKLKAPVGRLNNSSVPQPFSRSLEAAVTITVEKVMDAVKAIINGQLLPQKYTFVTGIQSKNNLSRNESLVSDRKDTSKHLSCEFEQTSKDSIEVIVPNQGLTITEVKIVKWNKEVGDPVKKGEPLLEFETDKAVVELESPADGKLSKIVADVEAIVAIGALVGIIALN
jgi:2-oxoisovalerate dehydrogenase E1 component